jgi:hypothetical protein
MAAVNLVLAFTAGESTLERVLAAIVSVGALGVAIFYLIGSPRKV